MATAEMFARYAWEAKASEPRLAAAYASLLARPGSEDALQRGIDLCDEAFLSRQSSTDDAWTELAAKRAQLVGQLSRLRALNTTDLDADGNPVRRRRHHPEQPRRVRQRRFVVHQ
jgi:hypothetical protein